MGKIFIEYFGDSIYDIMCCKYCKLNNIYTDICREDDIKVYHVESIFGESSIYNILLNCYQGRKDHGWVEYSSQVVIFDHNPLSDGKELPIIYEMHCNMCNMIIGFQYQSCAEKCYIILKNKIIEKI